MSVLREEIENRMVVDSEWPEEPEMEPGYNSRFGAFVKEEYLLEVAMEQTFKEPIIRDDFLENALDYIESNKDATKKFLKWFYPQMED